MDQMKGREAHSRQREQNLQIPCGEKAQHPGRLNSAQRAGGHGAV